MRVTVLGSGEAVPTARRSCAGYLVAWSARAVLLAASAGTYMRALKAGLEPRALSALALTHFHADHCADLPSLLQARRLAGLPPLPIAAPAGLSRLLAGFAAIFGAWVEEFARPESYPFALDGLSIRAFPALHGQGSVSLRLEAEGKSLAYSGDTADCPGLREACRGADLALLECTSARPMEGHMTPQDCAAVAAACGVGRLLLTHLGPDVETGLPRAEDGLVVTV
ncbi:MAG: MBL fold metallo-hydrolase [Planctomycetota bacterium]